MKKIYLFGLLFAFFQTSIAQNQGFNYKFLIFDNNMPYANAAVSIKFTIKDGATVVWEEEHTGIMTDANGIASCYLGEGTRLSGTAANFDDIDWSADLTYDVDVNTGSGYTNLVSGKPFKHVPKAKYAETADFNNLTNKPVTFYLNGTTSDYPTDINDDMYHTGSVAIGDNMVLPNVRLSIVNNRSGNQVGGQFTLSSPSGDNGAKTALKTTITGQGNGYLSGQYNYINSDGTGTNTVIRNRIEGAGTGTHVGIHNFLRGTGGGFQVGEYTQIDNAGDNYHYGNYLELSGSGSGIHVGLVTSLHGNGTGVQRGIWNYLNTASDEEQYGVFNEISGSGNGDQYGTYNKLYNTGTGDKYGTYVNIDPSTG
jgi:hypothetical protein